MFASEGAGLILVLLPFNDRWVFFRLELLTGISSGSPEVNQHCFSQ
jgi:hypothetical protein